MATMAAQNRNFLPSYEESSPDFHCPMVYCRNLRGNIGAGTFVSILCDNQTREGLIVGCTNRLLDIPDSERASGTPPEPNDHACGWVKVVIMLPTLEGGIEDHSKFIPLRSPEVQNMEERVMTLEYCWVRCTFVQEFLWVFRPDTDDAALANGMVCARILRYRLTKDSVPEEVPELMYLSFPSIYSEYQSMYDDCYPKRLFYSLSLIRLRIAAILNRVTMSQGSEFCINRNMPLISMGPDCWSYIRRYLLKEGLLSDDYTSKRVVGNLHGCDLSYHAGGSGRKSTARFVRGFSYV
jgi:hypothetical protein